MKDNPNKIFKKEFKIYNDSLNFIKKQNYDMNEMLDKYRSLTENYGKLLNILNKIYKIINMQKKDLKKREYDIKNLLDNSDQGFLTFNKSLLVDREYSLECYRIFNREIANLNILELLRGENEGQNIELKKNIESIFVAEDLESKQFYLSKLPKILKINNKYINIKYKIVKKDEFYEDSQSLMLILTEISKKCNDEDEILYLSYHDKLTSLYNRAYVENILPLLNNSSNFPFSVIMADLNALKLVNDVFGHENGDKLIKKAAKVLIDSCRKNDIVARWGGDEFLIILPNTNHRECTKICERIKKMCNLNPLEPIDLSISLGNATSDNMSVDIMSLMNIAENTMYDNKLIESHNTRKKILYSIENMLNDKCSQFVEHTNRMKFVAKKFYYEIFGHLNSKDIEHVEAIVELHDIGKATIPVKLLNKTEPLSLEEKNILQKHTEIGYRMVQAIEEPILAQEILAIREHWDGSGYPYGLKGEQIPINSRIIAIIEAYDVMTHDQPYKKKVSSDEAVKELEKLSGSRFDPNLIKIFLANIHNWYKDERKLIF